MYISSAERKFVTSLNLAIQHELSISMPYYDRPLFPQIDDHELSVSDANAIWYHTDTIVLIKSNATLLAGISWVL